MYEAPEIIGMGAAHELILGQKAFLIMHTDSEGATNRDERDTDDIDETDE